MLAVCGVILCLIAEIFTTPLLNAFGTPADVFSYAEEYIRITAIGFPFLLLTTGGGHLIRADGSPKMTMLCNLSGAIINIFFFYFNYSRDRFYPCSGMGQRSILHLVKSLCVFLFSLLALTLYSQLHQPFSLRLENQLKVYSCL